MVAKSYDEVPITACSRRSPNGETYPLYADAIEPKPGEVKYLSNQRKRNRKEIPLVVTSEQGRAQTPLV